MSDLWRDISGHAGYQISADGRVRSLSRLVKCRDGQRLIPGGDLRLFIAVGTGYLQVALQKKRHSVHRLVAGAWCPGYFEGAVVDHVNGVRTDNRRENLEWVTYSENARRSFKHGRVSQYLGCFSSDHPTSKGVVATHVGTGAETTFSCAMDAVRAGFDSSCISRCCNGLSKSHKGHTWRFAALIDTRRSGYLEGAAA